MLKLDAESEALLHGEGGGGAALAMRLVVRMAELQGASRLLPITGAHVDGAVYEGDAVVDFVEHFQRLGARVSVPTTLNAVSVEVGTWQRLGLEPRFGRQATRIVDAYLAMGLRPTFSCAPYQQHHPLPGLGDQVAWGESNAVAYCNSVLGARTEQYGDFLDISAAVAGRVPAVGLHLSENRRATVRMVLDDAVTPDDMASDLFWPLLGYVVGERAGHRVPALEGITVKPTDDQLKSLLAAAASSGAVALLHIAGVTPEAPDSVAPFDGPPPPAEIISRQDLVDAARRLSGTAEGAALDAVALGSPHFSPSEFSALATLTRGRVKHPAVRVLVTTSRTSRAIAEASGALADCEAFGVEVVSDTCILLAPLLAPEVKTLMTNSGKYAHYSPGRLNVDVVMGTLQDAVRSAELGRVAFVDGRWRA